jgi:uncharacterized PurR-regulated membrane protein YhhQ (DUF165 family)
MSERNRILGFACLAGFIGCVFLANYAIENWGTVPFPGGPHTVTLLGLTAPSGVLVVGLSFSLRDGAQLALGRWWVLGAIVVGAALSYLVAPSLAWASGVAFLLGETFDWAVYTPLAERGRWTWALVLSNTVGSAVDSAVFLWLAFSSLEFFWGNFWLKALMILPALVVVVPFRIRRAVSRQPVYAADS